MANRSVELEIKLKGAQSISDLEAVIKELNSELKLVDANSESFNDLGNLLKKANTSLSDVKENLKSISSEKTTTATIKLGEGLVGAFALANVASQSFSKSTQEDLQKVIATGVQLQVVLGGLKPIVESLNASNRMAFAEMINKFKESAIGATLFGTAMRTALTLGVFTAVIAALGVIAANWESIKENIGLSHKALDEYVKTQNSLVESQKSYNSRLNEQLDLELEIAKVRGESAGKILQKEIDLTNTKLAQAKELRKELLDIYYAIPNSFKDSANEKDKKTYNDAKKAYFDSRLEVEKLERQQTLLLETQKKLQADNQKDLNALTKQFIANNQKVIDAEDEKVAKIIEGEIKQMQAESDAAIAQDEAGKKYLKDLEEQRKAKQEQIDLEYELKLGIDNTKKSHQSQFDDFNKNVQKALPYIQQTQEFINGIGAAFVQTISANIDSLGTEIDVITSRFQESVSVRQSLEAQLADAQGARRDQLLEGIDAETKKEKKLADDKKKLQNEEIKQKNKLNEINWRLSLINATVNTASAVIQALNGPYPLSLVFAALAGILGGVQIGVIAGNKPEKIPTFAKGGFTNGLGFTDNTGHEVAGTVHANEYVVPAHIMQSSTGKQLVNALESMRLGMPSFATGGFTSAPVMTEQSFNTLTGDALVAAVKSANIRVSVDEITSVQSRVQVLESNASF